MPLDGTLAVTVQSGAVEFEFAVANAGDQSVDLTFPSGQEADVVVFADGDEVWRWSDGRMFTQALQRRTLDPGESLTSEMRWEDPSSGAYTAEASLAANGTDALVRESFEVP